MLGWDVVAFPAQFQFNSSNTGLRPYLNWNWACKSNSPSRDVVAISSSNRIGLRPISIFTLNCNSISLIVQSTRVVVANSSENKIGLRPIVILTFICNSNSSWQATVVALDKLKCNSNRLSSAESYLNAIFTCPRCRCLRKLKLFRGFAPS